MSKIGLPTSVTVEPGNPILSVNTPLIPLTTKKGRRLAAFNSKLNSKQIQKAEKAKQIANRNDTQKANIKDIQQAYRKGMQQLKIKGKSNYNQPPAFDLTQNKQQAIKNQQNKRAKLNQLQNMFSRMKQPAKQQVKQKSSQVPVSQQVKQQLSQIPVLQQVKQQAANVIQSSQIPVSQQQLRKEFYRKVIQQYKRNNPDPSRPKRPNTIPPPRPPRPTLQESNQYRRVIRFNQNPQFKYIQPQQQIIPQTQQQQSNRLQSFFSQINQPRQQKNLRQLFTAYKDDNKPQISRLRKQMRLVSSPSQSPNIQTFQKFKQSIAKPVYSLSAKYNPHRSGIPVTKSPQRQPRSPYAQVQQQQSSPYAQAKQVLQPSQQKLKQLYQAYLNNDAAAINRIRQQINRPVTRKSPNTLSFQQFKASISYQPNIQKDMQELSRNYKFDDIEQLLNRLPPISTFRLENITTGGFGDYITIYDNVGRQIYMFDKVKELKGGKSGDQVIIVQRLDDKSIKEYILKLFKQEKLSKSTNTEIDIHTALYNTFKKQGEFIPIPKVLCYGKITDYAPFKSIKYDSVKLPENKMHQFIVMEKLTFQDNGVLEFGEHIKETCRNGESRGITVEDTRNLIMQLFYYLSTSIKEGYSHCDLHTKNIMIIEDRVPANMSFEHIGIEGSDMPLSNFRIKIIDFGESTRNPADCKKCRTLSAAIAELNKQCGVSGSFSNLSQILKGQLRRKQGASCDFSVDLMFFISILALLKNISQIPIDIKKLTTIAQQGKNITEQMLTEIYYELLLSLFLLKRSGEKADLGNLSQTFNNKIEGLLLNYTKNKKLAPNELEMIQPIIKARKQRYAREMQLSEQPEMNQMTQQQLQAIAPFKSKLVENVQDPVGARQEADRLRWYALRDKRSKTKKMTQQQVQQLDKLQKRFMMTPQQANKFKDNQWPSRIPQPPPQEKSFYAYPAQQTKQIRSTSTPTFTSTFNPMYNITTSTHDPKYQVLPDVSRVPQQTVDLPKIQKRTQMNPQQKDKLNILLKKKNSSLFGLSKTDKKQLDRLIRMNNYFNQIKSLTPPPSTETLRQSPMPLLSTPTSTSNPMYNMNPLDTEYHVLSDVNRSVLAKPPQRISATLSKPGYQTVTLLQQQRQKLNIQRSAQLLGKKNLTQQQRQQLKQLSQRLRIKGPQSQKQSKPQTTFQQPKPQSKKQPQLQTTVQRSKYPKCFTLGSDNSGIFCPSKNILRALSLAQAA